MSARVLTAPRERERTPVTATRWAARGSLAILDQGLTGVAGLLSNVLLARWLDPAAFGAFAVGFTVLLLVSTVHNSLVLEPMSVLGPSRHGARLVGYVRAQVTSANRRVGLGLAALLALISGGTAAMTQGPLASALVGAALATPFILGLWTARRAAYVVERPVAAVWGSAATLLLTVGGLSGLHWTGLVSPLAGFVVIGVAALVGSAIVLSTLPQSVEGYVDTRPLLGEQWRYGRWMLPAGILIVAGTQGQALIVAGVTGLEGAGALRAMQLAMLPAAHAIVALQSLAVPVLSRDAARGDGATVRRKARSLSLSLAAGALLYEVGLIVLHPSIERVLFGGAYADQSWLIPVLGLVPLVTGFTTGWAVALRAVQRPKHFLIAAAVTAPTGLITAAVLTPVWGAAGAAAAIVAAYAATAIALLVMYRMWVPAGVAD